MHIHTHRQNYLLFAGLSVGLDLLQCSVKEVCDRLGDKRKLHHFKNRSHEWEESWNKAERNAFINVIHRLYVD